MFICIYVLTSFFQRAPLSVIAPSGWIRLKFNLTLIASLLAEVLWIQQLYRFHKFLLCERNQVLPISVLYWSSLQWGRSYKFGEAWGQYLYLFIYGLQSIFEVCTLFDIYICVYFFFSLSQTVTGCFPALKTLVDENAVIIIAVALGIAALEVLYFCQSF